MTLLVGLFGKTLLTIVLGSITGLPIFRQHYGRYSGNETDGYQLEPA